MLSLPLKLYLLGPLSRDVIFSRPEDVQTVLRCGPLSNTCELVILPLLLRYATTFLVVVLLKSPNLLGPRSVER